MTRPFGIGGRPIGPDQPPYVIAEAGVNHNGELALAHRLIEAAADARTDAVKFQTFDPPALAIGTAEQAAYQRRRGVAGSQLEMLSALALPIGAWAEIRDHARRRGITFLSTPFDVSSVELLAGLGVPAFKVASGDLTDAFLLRAVARHGRPVILSTGMATIEEVGAALELVEGSGAPSVALLHCASVYPAEPRDLNLRAMDSLRDEFDRVVGFSDHSAGLPAPIAAVARGAAIIEKHFTLDRTLPGPDHAASLEPDELARMVVAVRETWEALGDGRKRPQPAELDTMRVARRSLVTARALPAGHRLAVGDLDAKRPGTGVSPMLVDEVVGRRLTVDAERDHLLLADELEPPLPTQRP